MNSLVQSPAILRPRYIEGQVVSAADLETGQEYLIAVRRRHLLSGHTFGVVIGLEPSFEIGKLWVSPGLAVDLYGNELLLRVKTPIALPRTGAAGDRAIYLRYRRAGLPNADPRHLRWGEYAVPSLEPLAPTESPAVVLTDLPPDSAVAAWPVLLGVLKPDGSIDLSGRARVCAVGTAVSDPRGTARIEFDQAGTMSVTSGAWLSPGLSVDGNGAAVVGDVVLGGTLTARLAVLLGRRPLPTAASPSSLYRTIRPPTRPEAGAKAPSAGAASPTPATVAPPAAAPPAAEELRIEAPALPAGPNPAQRTVSFGSHSVANGFDRIMSVLTDGTVAITGDVVIAGRLAAGPMQADPNDARFQQLLVDKWTHGAAAASAALEALYTGQIALENLKLSSTGNQEVSCTITVRNVGRVDVDTVQVTAGLAAQQTSTTEPLLPTGFALAVSASQTVTASPVAPGRGKVNVVVHANARGFKGAPVDALDVSGSVQV